jgi:hypothetical protein
MKYEDQLGGLTKAEVMSDGRQFCCGALPPNHTERCIHSASMKRAEKVAVKQVMPTDSKARKAFALYEGLFKYFPDALAAVAKHSYDSNEKHNPGEPLHWSRSKSADHEDCILRHTLDKVRSKFDPSDGSRHSTARAWRALASLQLELEADSK